MISVIIPTYNRAEYLKQAIGSVLNQTLKDFEIIVVDDASTDNTKETVLGCGDRVSYIYQDDKERAAARNKGISVAKGEYVAFLDSDDMWMPEHLEKCFDSIEKNKELGLVYSGSYMVDEAGKIISKMKAVSLKGDMLKYIVSKFSSGGCNASSCMVRKDIFDKAGYFDEDRSLSGSEDWDMWVRIASVTKFLFTKEFTVKVRSHDKQTSINADKMATSMIKVLDIVYQNKNILPAIESLKRESYSSLYTIIAINYYALGFMSMARGYLKKAIRVYPLAFFTNKYILYTLLRSFLGFKFSLLVRKTKERCYSLLRKNVYDKK